MPALLTRTVTGPKAAAASAARCADLSADPSRSAATKAACPPAAWMALTTSAPRAESRPVTTTLAPSAALAFATPLPMLLVEPVTRATLPSRRAFMTSGCLPGSCSEDLVEPVALEVEIPHGVGEVGGVLRIGQVGRAIGLEDEVAGVAVAHRAPRSARGPRTRRCRLGRCAGCAGNGGRRRRRWRCCRT